MIDDTYNANPGSMQVALDFLAAQPGKAWLVLGDMKELGAGSRKMHREVGENAAVMGVRRLFAIGEMASSVAHSIRNPIASIRSSAELALDGLQLAGAHNRENALAALCAAACAGADPNRALAALTTFEGLPHRAQIVARRGGVSFVDDSKATNIGAALAAPAVSRRGATALEPHQLGLVRRVRADRRTVAHEAQAPGGVAAGIRRAAVARFHHARPAAGDDADRDRRRRCNARRCGASGVRS